MVLHKFYSFLLVPLFLLISIQICWYGIFRGRKVDIWASGVTLYNLVSGEYPFEGDVIMRLFDNIANQPLKMPQSVSVSKALESLLTAMLEKDPDKRLDMDGIRKSTWFQDTYTPV